MHRVLDALHVLTLVVGLVVAGGVETMKPGSGARWKREEMPQDSQTSSSTEENGLPPEDLEPGPSLSEILGFLTIIITIIYIIGISWKVIKIYRGEYEPTEPVYLKYK